MSESGRHRIYFSCRPNSSPSPALLNHSASAHRLQCGKRAGERATQGNAMTKAAPVPSSWRRPLRPTHWNNFRVPSQLPCYHTSGRERQQAQAVASDQEGPGGVWWASAVGSQLVLPAQCLYVVLRVSSRSASMAHPRVMTCLLVEPNRSDHKTHLRCALKRCLPSTRCRSWCGDGLLGGPICGLAWLPENAQRPEEGDGMLA